MIDEPFFMSDALIDILSKYWKHNQFRPLQREIINSLLAGKDTLALLPTGGGKSICFQVPAMKLDGICIVISPLIALMKDQVENLKQRGIEAVAIFSGMSREEIDRHLDNCIHGTIKFLYVSPERVQTELFRERFIQMNVSFIAVDEAHCISQWGYDFRPPYLQIANLRELKPDVAIMALTATATPVVKDDIMQRLNFRKPYEVFQRTFARDNLSFVVRKSERKDQKLLEVLQKIQGSVIIYARSRKVTEELAAWLIRKNFSAGYYHAGLSFDDRTKQQEEWIKNKTRIMVATNAFGMGIDKPDVRMVIHLDLPENLEAYYQEAGRAGRDEKHAYAVVIYQDADIETLQKKVHQSLPELSYLKHIYQCLANYYQLAMGSGANESFDFDIHEFSSRFTLHQAEVYSALKKLEEEGLIQFSESFYSPSKIYVPVDKVKLYEFQIANIKFEPLLKTIFRLYGGQLFHSFVKVSESLIAKALQLSVSDVKQQLRQLNELRLIVYEPIKDQPQLTFLIPRQDADKLPIDRERLESRRKLILSKMESMKEFVVANHRCRMQLIQNYFGEDTYAVCGKCDVCVDQKKKENQKETSKIHQEIITVLRDRSRSIDELEQIISPDDTALFVDIVREMVDGDVLEYDSVWKLRIKK